MSRLILSRPAVEAGERLGFLPGDMREKVDPYLRPLYDALYDMIPAEKVERGLSAGMIEVAPLAFMRGRTLADAAIILDEAQNTTPMQMKMFLTRFGQNSKMIVTGDPTQIDLPHGQASGLTEALQLFTESRKSNRSLLPTEMLSATRWCPNRAPPMIPRAKTAMVAMAESSAATIDINVAAGDWPGETELKRLAEWVFEAVSGIAAGFPVDGEISLLFTMIGGSGN